VRLNDEVDFVDDSARSRSDAGPHERPSIRPTLENNAVPVLIECDSVHRFRDTRRFEAQLSKPTCAMRHANAYAEPAIPDRQNLHQCN
jgi:hypothetical protein